MRGEASENLFLLPAGSRSANPAELLAGKSLRPLVEKLKDYFDRIVIDTAPLVPVSDTIPLAKPAQSVVLARSSSSLRKKGRASPPGLFWLILLRVARLTAPCRPRSSPPPPWR